MIIKNCQQSTKLQEFEQQSYKNSSTGLLKISIFVAILFTKSFN